MINLEKSGIWEKWRKKNWGKIGKMRKIENQEKCTKLNKIDLQAHLLHPPKVILTRPTFHH